MSEDNKTHGSIVNLENEKKKRIRIRKCRRPKDFTQIHNGCIENPKLSGEALAILLYMMAKPEDWIVEIFDLEKRFNWKYRKLLNLLNELKEFGYMKRYQERNSDGTMGEWITEVADEPIFLEPRSLSPDVEKRHAVQNSRNSPDVEKTACGKNDMRSPYKTNKDLDLNKTTTTIMPIGNKKEVVVLIEKGFEESLAKKLVEKYGSERIIEMVKASESNPEIIRDPVGWIRKGLENGWRIGIKNKAQNKPNLPRRVYTRSENVDWFKSFNSEQKLKLYEHALFSYPAFELHMKNLKLDILNEKFHESTLFGVFMDTLKRFEK